VKGKINISHYGDIMEGAQGKLHAIIGDSQKQCISKSKVVQAIQEPLIDCYPTK
jgi:hypothetical protein